MENELKSRKKQLHLAFLVVQILLLFAGTIAVLASGEYGLTLFCIIPFSIGITIGIYSKQYKSKKFLKGTLWVLLVIGIISGLLLIGGIEGAICILLAIGFICLPALFGLWVGMGIRSLHLTYGLAFILIINTSGYVYDTNVNDFIHSTATKSLIINSTPDVIWRSLTDPVTFTDGDNFFLKAGLSYPQNMHIIEDTTGNCFLICNYRNGLAKLKITDFEKENYLKFQIEETVVAMKELTPYDSLHAEHLSGYFQPLLGEFILEKIDDTSTKLTARTEYTYKITPAFYWKLWSDYLLNVMHEHVLEDIKNISERRIENE